MRVKQGYENILMELNTVKAPSLHLEDYLYYINKGIQEYINVRYSLYQTTQQLTDDLQALSSTVSATRTNNITYSGSFSGNKNFVTGSKYNSLSYIIPLPDNYLHLLNCVVNIQTNIPYKCNPAGYIHSSNAKLLTSDIGAGVMNNAFLKPDYKRPYFNIIDDLVSNSDQGAIQILVGDANKFSLSSFDLDYLKKPQVINLTEAERDSIVDNSQIFEFPEYVCNEIIKYTVKLILENQQNNRLQTHIPLNQSIK